MHRKTEFCKRSDVGAAYAEQLLFLISMAYKKINHFEGVKKAKLFDVGIIYDEQLFIFYKNGL